MTLAPPYLPFPLDFTASWILKQSFPKGVPCVGSFSRDSIKSKSSSLKEGNFRESRLACLSKWGIVFTL